MKPKSPFVRVCEERDRAVVEVQKLRIRVLELSRGVANVRARATSKKLTEALGKLRALQPVPALAEPFWVEVDAALADYSKERGE